MRPLLLALAVLALAGCFSGTPCPSPLEQCGDSCYDLRSDPVHCGRCDRTCGSGLACVDARCATDPGLVECAARSGGAFVTVESCGELVKLWATSPTFISRAETLAADPAAAGPAIPRFDLRAASDCDDQWSWHLDPATAAFVAAPDTLCVACPSQVQGALSYWLADVGTWCPSPARIVAVNRQ
jgi:hypothetical protein